MPRPERALNAEAGPAAAFAAQLRQLRRRAGNPGYRQLSERAGYSVATLANAGGGRRLPSLPVAVAFVRACGGDVNEWERRWRLAVAEEARLRGAAVVGAATSAGCSPYLGLSGYEVGDADRFFGRQRMVSQLVGLLRRQRFLAVFGVSGSGKSSLLRAGLVPAVVTGGLTANAALGEDGAAADSAPLPVLMTPGAQPMAALKEALAEVAPQRAVLLVVDQFEEVFTLAGPAERGRFLAELAGSVGSAADPQTRVVLGVRADFYARCAALPELAALIAGANVPLGPLSADELREVVTGPARLAGLNVERALVTRIVSDALGQPGALPLVSHALLETWRQRRSELLTEAGYEAAGGIAGAIAQTAETVYLGLRPDRRESARLVLTGLVTLGEGVEDTRRHAARDEMDFPHVDEVLDRLAAARLVTIGDDTVELAHEAVIGAWPRLQRWLSDDREGLRIRHQLTDATRTWRELGRETGSLYRGVRLAAAWEWASRGRRRGELTTAERAFLDASVEAQDGERAIAARRSRQLRYLAAALAVLLAAACAVSVIAVWQRLDAVRASRVAISRQLAVQSLALVDSDPSTAMLLSVQAFRLAPTVEARSALLSMSARGAYQGELLGHTGAVSQVAFGPDGHTLLSVGRDQTVRVWDTAGRRLVATLTGHRAWLRSMALSPDGRLLASGGSDNKVVLWDLARRKPVAALSGHSGQINAVAFSPDGHTLATAAGDGAMLWDVTTHMRLATLTGRTGAVWGVAFSPDGHTLATGGDDGTAILWDVPSRTRLATLTGHTGAVRTVAFSPDGRTLATGGGATTVIVWDVGSHRRRSTLSHHRDGEVITVEFSPDGRTLASAGTDANVLLWDTDRWMLRGSLTNHGPNIYALSFAPHGGLLAAAGEGGVITLWDTSRSSLATEAADVRDIAVSRDGATLAVATGQRLELWNTQQRKPRAVLADGESINAVAYSPDGATMAAAVGHPGEPGRVMLWAAGADARPVTLTGHTDRILDVAFSPDGRLMATASVDRTVMLWDVLHRTHLATLTGHRDAVNGVAFSPDGQTLASAGHDPAVMLWDVEARTRLATLTGHTGWVRSVVFSPDGRSLASEDTDQTVMLWDVHRRTRVHTITDHADAVYTGVAFSPDSRTLAYTSGQDTVVLWDIASRAPIARLSGHTQQVRSVVFAPDGQTLAASGADRIVTQWSVDPNEAVTHVCAALVRDLTQPQWHQFIPDLPYEPTCTSGSPSHG